MLLSLPYHTRSDMDEAMAEMRWMKWHIKIENGVSRMGKLASGSTVH
jgi:hypothetical protein